MSNTEEKIVETKVIPQDDGTAIVKHLPGDIEEELDDDKGRETRGDRRQGRDTEEDDDTGRDTSGGGGGETSRNRRRRQRAREAREKREGDISTLSTVVESQQRMIAALSRGQQQQALITLESEARQCQEAYAEAKRRKAKAVTDGDGAASTEADTVMLNANNYYQQLVGQHRNIQTQMQKTAPAAGDDQGGEEDTSQQRRQPNAKPQLTAPQRSKLVKLKEAFLDAHPEVDPETDDDVQAAIKAIDAKVDREGFEPWTEDYWDELSERLQKAGLVKGRKGGRNVDTRRRRADDEELDDDTARRRVRQFNRREEEEDDDRGGPPTGGAGRGNGGGGGAETRLSAEMVKALDDANIPLTGGTPETIKRRNRILDAWKGGPPSAQDRRR